MSEPENDIKPKCKSRAGRFKKSNMTPENWKKYLEKAKIYSKTYRDRKRAEKLAEKEDRNDIYQLYIEGKLIQVK